MSEKVFNIRICTPEGVKKEYEACSLTINSEKGEIGILANHAPMLCAVNEGECRVTLPDGSTEKITVGRGFLNVKNNSAEIITT